MAKYKFKTKDRTLIVKVRLSFGEKLNEKEIASFARKYIRGLLKTKVIKKNCVEYTGPIGISLEDRMKKPISKHDFFFIIEQIVDITQKLDVNEMDVNYVIFDMKNVYINKTTKEMQFIYLPVEELKAGTDIIGFIENIIYSVIPMPEQDDDYVSKFTYFIKGLHGYSASAIETYILKEDRSVVNTIKRHSTGQSGFMTDKPENYYKHYGGVDEEATGLLGDEEATGMLDDEEATGLLNDNGLTDMSKTNQHVHYATIYRVLTEETIEIDKPVFRIGKERSYSDYFVANNDKVSRSHADIITRNGRYYVADLNSRNRTFVNGLAIPSQQEKEIFEGDSIRLANEEFVFHA